jgi:hypothetical protein
MKGELSQLTVLRLLLRWSLLASRSLVLPLRNGEEVGIGLDVN